LKNTSRKKRCEGKRARLYYIYHRRTVFAMFEIPQNSSGETTRQSVASRAF
jgi:hypothetical protein